jgi:hypothetical protein
MNVSPKKILKQWGSLLDNVDTNNLILYLVSKQKA